MGFDINNTMTNTRATAAIIMLEEEFAVEIRAEAAEKRSEVAEAYALLAEAVLLRNVVRKYPNFITILCILTLHRRAGSCRNSGNRKVRQSESAVRT